MKKKKLNAGLIRKSIDTHPNINFIPRYWWEDLVFSTFDIQTEVVYCGKIQSQNERVQREAFWLVEIIVGLQNPVDFFRLVG